MPAQSRGNCFEAVHDGRIGVAKTLPSADGGVVGDGGDGEPSVRACRRFGRRRAWTSGGKTNLFVVNAESGNMDQSERLTPISPGGRQAYNVK